MVVIETGLQFRQPLARRSYTNYIVLHHADASQCTIWDVHSWHLAKGYAGCGYHYFISKKGEIYRGRPRDTIGAHAYGFNSYSVGICHEGNFEAETMPAEQWRASLWLVNQLKQIYPQAVVVGHRELNETECPGRYFPLEEIKNGIAPPEEVRKVTEPWKELIMEWARDNLGISSEHQADDPSPKWFTIAVLQRGLDKLEKRIRALEEALKNNVQGNA